MAGIIPTSGAGGVVIRDAGGECLELLTPPPNAYCPDAAFTSTCLIRYLPSNCDARIMPAQINAFQSELLCFAETLNPAGNWNCGSLCNLSANFTQWLTSDVGYEGSYLRVLQDHLCARPFIADLDEYPDATMIICDGEGNIARAAIPTGGGGGGGDVSYANLILEGGHQIGTITSGVTDYEVYETETSMTLEETLPGVYRVTYNSESGEEYWFNLPTPCCIEDVTFNTESRELGIYTGQDESPFVVTIPAGTGVEEAPEDGVAYSRKDAAWVPSDVPSIDPHIADYTIQLADMQRVVVMVKATPITLIVPHNDDVAFPAGASILMIQYGAGKLSVVGDAGVTINSPETLNLRKQYSMATVLKTEVNTWVLSGDLELI